MSQLFKRHIIERLFIQTSRLIITRTGLLSSPLLMQIVDLQLLKVIEVISLSTFTMLQSCTCTCMYDSV